ncbi:cytosine permease [Chromohalobacter japonicus]|uniref:cytosine permease n=1 Tax=Chromohalobacter japonicus TaxID=223900 RepID=UPI001FF6A612|nr:cytosine permease [Chromohalobacter japonicus]MCK0752850.1 cytosine permease [Chromohalobacter japonicus]
MNDNDLRLTAPDASLYNADLAPLPHSERRWGAFEIFNVWANDIQSLFGYTLAASLFLSYGLNGWAVMAAIILAGLVVMVLVNLTGRPSVKYGIPFPVVVRASLGVHGANLPAMLRAVIGIFWYGVQTYFASTAVTLLLTALGIPEGGQFLGLSSVAWLAFVIVWVFQLAMFWAGIERIKRFLNWAGPLVYAVMIVLMGVVWWQAGASLLPAIGNIFSGNSDAAGSAVGAFFTVLGTMIAYFAAVVINFGDFARFVKSERAMRLGNLLGLPLNVAVFSFIAFFIGALWVSVISQIGIPGFVNAIGAVIAPFYGIIVIDYYVIRRGHLDVQALFSTAPGSAYYYQNGWNRRGLAAFAIGALFSLASVWVPALAALEGFAWLLGAGLGGACYYALMRGQVSTPAEVAQ